MSRKRPALALSRASSSCRRPTTILGTAFSRFWLQSPCRWVSSFGAVIGNRKKNITKASARVHLLLLLAFFAFVCFQTYLSVRAADLAHRRDINLALPPVSLEKILAEPEENWPYRRVVARGMLVPFVEAYLHVPAREGGEPGVKVHIPLELRHRPFDELEEDVIARPLGRIVMADAGYVEWPLPRRRPPPEKLRVRNFAGVLSPAQERSFLTPSPEPDLRVWYGRDVQAMTRDSLIEVPSIVFFIESPTGGGRRMLPLDKPARPPHEAIAAASFGAAGLFAILWLSPRRRREAGTVV